MELYDRLAGWWPLLSAPADYAEEAELFHASLREAVSGPLQTWLELGSGGGNTASHLRERVDLTLVDRSAGMLAVSRALNPGCVHAAGDMRTVRLGRDFDAVLVHDAIAYMTSRADLRAAVETAWVHCRPGGAALFVPDDTRETFRPRTSHGGHGAPDGRGLRYLSWSADPDPADDTTRTDYAILLREAGGATRVVHDVHTLGLFGRAFWLETLAAVGFAPRTLPFLHSELPADEGHELFLAVRPPG